MRRVRVGAVSYLNTWPLVHGLRSRTDLVDLRFDVPSRCAALLHEGAVDVGLIPSIEFLRGDYVAVPGIAIASEGPVASVALFSRVPVRDVRRIALDTSSRTSAALVRVLCAEHWGIAPEFSPCRPGLPGMLERHDAALLIGDNALFADHDALGLCKVDLGEEWTSLTGLPFVWAFWAGRAGDLSDGLCRALADSRDAGVRALDEIATGYSDGDEQRRAIAAHYLREHMRYELGDRHVEALRRFYRAAADLGIVGQARPVRFAACAHSECAQSGRPDADPATNDELPTTHY